MSDSNEIDLQIKKLQLEQEKMKSARSAGCTILTALLLLPIFFIVGSCSWIALTSH
jgi:hypothetical protein